LFFSFFFSNFVAVKYVPMQFIFKHIVTCITLVCFLTATNGLNLIEHYCSAKNKSFLFLMAQNANCDSHSCSPEACCSHEHTSDCCQNISHFTQLDVDFFSTHHDLKIDSCPVFYIVDLFSIKNVACKNCCSLHCSIFLSDIGLSIQLRIKQTTEFLL